MLRRAMPVMLLTPVLAAAQEAAQQRPSELPSGPPMTVRGMVSNAATGDPLPRVLVRIEGDADAGVLTDGEGRFEFPAVPLGPQTIRLLKPGFHDRPYATEDVDYQSDGPAHSVLVAPRMPDLNFSLTPNASIHGFVELSTGDPAQDIPITLLKQVIHDGRAIWARNGSARTTGDGAYHFAGLPDGVYAVYTQPVLESEPAVTVVAAGSAASVARNGYPTVFYPNAREFSSAMRIRLSTGEHAQANLTLALEPFHTVTASAFFPNGKQFAPKAGSESGSTESLLSATVLDAAGRRLPYTGEFDAASHTIQATLPDGIYTLQVAVASNEASLSSGGDMGPKAGRRQATYTGMAEFSVEGHAVANLHIPLAQLPSWPVHLRIAQSDLRPPQATSAGQGMQNLVTVSAADAGETPAESANSNGSAEASGPNLLDLSGAGFGPVWINAQVTDRSLCVDSFTAGGTNLAREPLNLNPSAAPPPMELTLRADCSTLTLELPPALTAFLPGEEPFYTVYIVPDFDTTADVPPLNVHPSSGATLTLEGLTPGRYHVYVFDSPVRLEYRNPAVLAALPSRGQAVTLSPGAITNLVLETPER